MDANFTPANIVSGPARRKHYLGRKAARDWGASRGERRARAGSAYRNTDSPTEKLLRRDAGSIR